MGYVLPPQPRPQPRPAAVKPKPKFVPVTVPPADALGIRVSDPLGLPPPDALDITPE